MPRQPQDPSSGSGREELRSPPRKEYSSPEIRRLGTLHDLTRGGGDEEVDDTYLGSAGSTT